MRHVARRMLTLSALYICIIFGIFFVQFTNGRAFSLSLGPMLVSGSSSVGEDGAEVPGLPLHVGANGLDLFFDQQNRLLAWTGDKNSVSLDVTGFGRRDSGFEVRFTGGVSVYFQADRRGDTDVFAVSAVIPQKYIRVTIPYRISRSARLEKKDSLVLVSAGKSKYSFSQAQVFLPSGTQRLAVNRAAPVVYYQTWRPAKGLVIEDLAGLPGASATVLQGAREKFAANALASFRGAVNAGAFDEELAVAYAAEMGRVGMYRAALDAIPSAFASSASRTWKSSSFFNHLEKTWAPFTADERSERSRLSRLLGERDPLFFEFPSILPYLVDRGSTVLFEDLAKFTAALDMTRVTPLQAAGILEAAMDAPLVAPSLSEPFSALAESCERKLKASLWRVQDSLYLSGDGASVDTAETFRVAAVLSRYGREVPGKKAWESAGNLLAATLLDFAGARAELPARFAVTGTAEEKTGVVAKTERMLMAKEVYPLVMASNTWLPHAVSFAKAGEGGLWAWTSAQSVSVSRPEPKTLRFVTRFPVGETHYMVIRGVKPFSRIQIYGMDFRTDPRFESYNSSGYRYSEETETLYLKMRHKSEYEEVTLYLGAPETLPNAASPATETSGSSADPAVSGQNPGAGQNPPPGQNSAAAAQAGVQ